MTRSLQHAPVDPSELSEYVTLALVLSARLVVCTKFGLLGAHHADTFREGRLCTVVGRRSRGCGAASALRRQI